MARNVEAAWAREIGRRLNTFEESKAKSRTWSSIKDSILKTQRARVRRLASRG